jgi:flagellar biosynthesis/type III secretory pathway protein FliH
MTPTETSMEKMRKIIGTRLLVHDGFELKKYRRTTALSRQQTIEAGAQAIDDAVAEYREALETARQEGYEAGYRAAKKQPRSYYGKLGCP